MRTIEAACRARTHPPCPKAGRPPGQCEQAGRTWCWDCLQSGGMKGPTAPLWRQTRGGASIRGAQAGLGSSCFESTLSNQPSSKQTPRGPHGACPGPTNLATPALDEVLFRVNTQAGISRVSAEFKNYSLIPTFSQVQCSKLTIQK